MLTEDRELLELAAKAAGVDFGSRSQLFNKDAFFLYTWNPLEDDGDAMRLATKLGLHVFGREIGCSVGDNIFVDAADCNGDPCAATRRAIVRAAAEIGRSIG